MNNEKTNNYKNNVYLQNAFCELTSNGNNINNCIYWLQKYIKENPNDIFILPLEKSLSEAEDLINKVFSKLDTIFIEK